jgi:hypothetical protein
MHIGDRYRGLMPRVFGASSRKASNNGAVGISGIGIGYRRSPSWKWEGSKMLGLQAFTRVKMFRMARGTQDGQIDLTAVGMN